MHTQSLWLSFARSLEYYSLKIVGSTHTKYTHKPIHSSRTCCSREIQNSNGRLVNSHFYAIGCCDCSSTNERFRSHRQITKLPVKHSFFPFYANRLAWVGMAWDGLEDRILFLFWTSNLYTMAPSINCFFKFSSECVCVCARWQLELNPLLLMCANGVCCEALPLFYSRLCCAAASKSQSSNTVANALRSIPCLPACLLLSYVFFLVRCRCRCSSHSVFHETVCATHICMPFFCRTYIHTHHTTMHTQQWGALLRFR